MNEFCLFFLIFWILCVLSAAHQLFVEYTVCCTVHSKRCLWTDCYARTTADFKKSAEKRNSVGSGGSEEGFRVSTSIRTSWNCDVIFWLKCNHRRLGQDSETSAWREREHKMGRERMRATMRLKVWMQLQLWLLKEVRESGGRAKFKQCIYVLQQNLKRHLWHNSTFTNTCIYLVLV